MKVTEKIKASIKKIPERKPFGYAQLNVEPGHFYTAAKAMERLQKQGLVKKVSKGIFYKPKATTFGELGPDYNALLNNYLFKNGKRVGYITGTALYNQLNLTTQLPFSIKIATNKSRKSVGTGWLKANIAKSYVAITSENYQLLGVLDALKDFKQIPDLDRRSAVIILSNKLKALKPSEIKVLIECSLKYPPRVRAFLGALLENTNIPADLVLLKKSLNPFSQYDYKIENTILPTAKNWNIK